MATILHCPFCGSPVTKVRTPNGGEGICVVEDVETFDLDISIFQCDKFKKHVFYADDGKSNSQDKSLPIMR